VRILRFDYEDCRKRRLLRSTIPSEEKAQRSIKKAENWLEEAEKNMESGAYDSCLISSYLVMFHSARSVLIRDGVIEKSHYCIARYLEEKYMKKRLLEQKWVDILDRFRNIRHSDQYDVSYFAS
jgi:uncharacterized protein (UPF0332 family)